MGYGVIIIHGMSGESIQSAAIRVVAIAQLCREQVWLNHEDRMVRVHGYDQEGDVVNNWANAEPMSWPRP